MIMYSTIKLSELPLSKMGEIIEIDRKCKNINRLIDLGICVKARICPEFKSPFGEPTAFRINNTLIALRKSDCDKIIVKADGV